MAEPSGPSEAWETMDIEELNKHYSPTLWSQRIVQAVEGSDNHPLLDAHIKTLQEGTARGKAVAQTMLDVSYGPGDDEKMDIYLPVTPNPAPPVFIYIHGGYWKLLGKEFSGYMVPPLVNSGAVVVALSYTLAPKGSMDLMVDQMRRALAFICRQYSHFSGMYLCGHSAGAHLSAMVLATDWSLPEYGVTPDLKGAMLLSGLFDLRPLVRSYVNEALNMTEEDMTRNSPIFKVGAMPVNCPILLAVAEHDPPELQRQSQELAQSLKHAGINVTYMELPNVDHFDLVENLSSEEYQLTQVIKEMMFGGVKT